MKTQYFKCTLKTDIVVNASLATEGNMTTLNYIPGSNFLGIVAGKLYKDNRLSEEDKFNIFHSDKVSFGDALIAKNNTMSYAIPFSFFQDKLNKGLGKKDTKTWVHHLLNGEKPKNKDGLIQLKQHRGGFLNKKNDYIKKVEKQFSLKSAHNRDERRSAEGKMFGFESIKKGQVFIFSVLFKDDNYEKIITDALIGDKRIGKSKTAQFGQVHIEKINDVSPVINGTGKNNQLVIYAESNLCFLNENRQSTFQPKLSDFGIEKADNITINWDQSQIRTYSYSPWNSHRNTTNTQRDTIAKGSVIIINGNFEMDKLKTQVGEYTAEGLGRVIYNPEFIEATKEGVLTFALNELKESSPKKYVELKDITTNSKLGDFLHNKLKVGAAELEIGEAVIKVLDAKGILTHKDITPSQWGSIRTKATNANSIDELISVLFGDEKLEKKEKDLSGYLTHGVADERVWGKNRGARRTALKKVISDNSQLGTAFVARLAADLAKLNKGK